MEDKRTEEEKVISALEQMKEAYFTILELSGNGNAYPEYLICYKPSEHKTMYGVHLI